MQHSGSTIHLTATDSVNPDGSRRSDLIRRHCAKGMAVELRVRDAPESGVVACVRVPRLFGLLGSRLAPIGNLPEDHDHTLARRLTRGHRIAGMVVSVAPANGDGKKSRVGISVSYADFPPSR